MSTAGADLRDPYRLGRHGEGPHPADQGPAPKRIVVGYGFWIFLLSDFVLFSAFFAAFAVLRHSTAGGPSGPELFQLRSVKLETVCLLLSSFACGVAGVGVAARRQLWVQVSLLVTGLLGLAFLLQEASEFAAMVARGAGPQRSAFLSSFFTLVGCHGIHVTCGLLWLGTMMAQFWAKGFTAAMRRRFLCFSLFWHALDIIWVAVFTVVYLIGGSR